MTTSMRILTTIKPGRIHWKKRISDEGDAREVRHQIEMGVVAEKRQETVTGECGDPHVVGRYGRAARLQVQAYLCVSLGHVRQDRSQLFMGGAS